MATGDPFPWELRPDGLWGFVLSDSSHGFGHPKSIKSGPLGNWPKSDQFSIEICHILDVEKSRDIFVFFERNDKGLRETHFHGSFVQVASGASF